MLDINEPESFPDMLRRVLGDRLRPNCDTFVDMFAQDGVLEYPFAPPGLNTPLKGQDAIIANFQRIRKLLRIDSVTNVSQIEVSDPNTVILEFYGRGEGVVTGEAYEQRYVSIIRLHDGRITHYKDYWNPIAVLRAVKGSEATRALNMD